MLEWMRTPVTKLSGTGMLDALDRSSYVLGLGTGAVDVSGVAPVKLAELAAYGMTAKAPKIRQLKGARAGGDAAVDGAGAGGLLGR
jgi:hypothetical protein